MDEKTGEETASTVDPALDTNEEETSAGNESVTENTEPTEEANSEELLQTDAEKVQISESTDELKEAPEHAEVEASLVSTDTNESIENENNLKSTEGEGSSTEEPISTNSETIKDILTDVTDETPNNDNLENHKEATDVEDTEVTSEDLKPMDLDKSEAPVADSNNSVYQLEEELKRLHGDTSEETKTENFEGELSVASILEEKSDSVPNNSVENNIQKPLIKMEKEKPIMKDSDLEEMLAADDVAKDPVLIKGKLFIIILVIC